jgi:hypothetical protein
VFFAHLQLRQVAQRWEYTVLATNATHDIAAIGPLYRDRCGCENGFDEALTSRPLLLAAVGRAPNSSNQTTLYLTPMHAEAILALHDATTCRAT